MAFRIPEDIANRALQHVGAPLITSLSQQDRGAIQINQCYDGLRMAELRRNVWTFAVRKAVLYPINTQLSNLANETAMEPSLTQTATQTLPTMLFVPTAWSPSKIYPFGSIVSYQNSIWVSNSDDNEGAAPGETVTGQPGSAFGQFVFGQSAFGGSPVVSGNWDTYFGSMCVQPYDSTVAYYAGDLVYVANNNNTVTVYVSLQNGNSVQPTAAAIWSPTIVYSLADIVQDTNGVFWQSNITFNLNNPLPPPAAWNSGTAYVIGNQVTAMDNAVYQALGNTTNNNPTAQGSPTQWLYMGFPWAASEAPASVNSAWLALDSTVDNLNINYPISSGPSIQTFTKNVFQLPNGYLRVAPQEPKRGSTSFLGAPTGLMYTDWEFDGNYIVSSTPFPIILRFVANITQVTTMDDMFCEGLGCRIGEEICEAVTQSASKIAVCAAAYKVFMGEARTVNGIEQGATEPPEDDFITCRI